MTSIMLSNFNIVMNGADLKKYTFSLLNREEKVYLFKSAHFILYKLLFIILRLIKYNDNH